MPELPEVETIARALKFGGRGGDPILGYSIRGAHLLWERTLAYSEPPGFLARIRGQAIVDVGRRGKFLVFTLDRDHLIIHLRMSGDIRVEPVEMGIGQAEPFQLHDRLVIDLDSMQTRGLRMAFTDARKFGRIWLVNDPQSVLGGLGPEPLSEDFGVGDLYHKLHAVNRMIKPLLLDQTFIAGLGNIYTDEALHLAGIHPQRSSATINPAEAEGLLRAIRSVLSEGIRRNGASIDWVYRGGDFQDNFHVYQRTGLPCIKCGTPIQKIVLGQRGTHFCPSCQPLHRPVTANQAMVD